MIFEIYYMCVALKNIFKDNAIGPICPLFFIKSIFFKFSLLKKKILTFALRIASSTFKNSLSMYRKVHITHRDGSIAKEPTILA